MEGYLFRGPLSIESIIEDEYYVPCDVPLRSLNFVRNMKWKGINYSGQTLDEKPHGFGRWVDGDVWEG